MCTYNSFSLRNLQTKFLILISRHHLYHVHCIPTYITKGTNILQLYQPHILIRDSPHNIFEHLLLNQGVLILALFLQLSVHQLLLQLLTILRSALHFLFLLLSHRVLVIGQSIQQYVVGTHLFCLIINIICWVQYC